MTNIHLLDVYHTIRLNNLQLRGKKMLKDSNFSSIMETGDHSKNWTNPKGKTAMKKMILSIFILTFAFIFITCGGDSDSDDNGVTYPNLVIGSIEWAGCNVDSYKAFAAKPDMYTKFYQWNRSKAWPATGSISGTWETGINDPEWIINPCPAGWRLPTMAEQQNLRALGGTWAEAGTRGNSVAGMFLGQNHATASLPDNMDGAIFLPACGARVPADGSLIGQGELGIYHSANSTYVVDRYYAQNMMFNDDPYLGEGYGPMDNFTSIRPVRNVAP